MRLKLGLMLAMLVLAGCESDEDIARQRAEITSNLPEGCEFMDLGSYRSIDQVVVIICDDRKTISTNSMAVKTSGKTTTYEGAASFLIE